MKMSVTLAGSTPAAASEVDSLPAPGPKTDPAPVSNSSTRSVALTSSGWIVSCSLSVGCPAAPRTAATSSGVRPTPKTLLSFGSSMLPSLSAMAERSPIMNSSTPSFFTAGGLADTGASAGVAVVGAGASSFFEQAASMNGAATATTSATSRIERSSICELL